MDFPSNPGMQEGEYQLCGSLPRSSLGAPIEKQQQLKQSFSTWIPNHPKPLTVSAFCVSVSCCDTVFGCFSLMITASFGVQTQHVPSDKSHEPDDQGKHLGQESVSDSISHRISIFCLPQTWWKQSNPCHPVSNTSSLKLYKFREPTQSQAAWRDFCQVTRRHPATGGISWDGANKFRNNVEQEDE